MTRVQPAGDVDYAKIGVGYSKLRQPDPRIAAMIRARLGAARTVLNVGAGAGSYEPLDRHVIAIEPAATMRAQRPAHLSPAIDAVAEKLPLDDASVDASMAILTVHQWKDRAAGLRELLRVTRGAIVLMTFDPATLHVWWLDHYVSEMHAAERGRLPGLEELAQRLSEGGRRVEVVPVPIPRDCTDGFTEAYFARPERFLEPAVTGAQSVWEFVGRGVRERFVGQLGEDLRSGAWDAKFGAYRAMETMVGALRLVVSVGEEETK
jgi:SAM-dependent methyltransferase